MPVLHFGLLRPGLPEIAARVQVTSLKDFFSGRSRTRFPYALSQNSYITWGFEGPSDCISARCVEQWTILSPPFLPLEIRFWR